MIERFRAARRAVRLAGTPAHRMGRGARGREHYLPPTLTLGGFARMLEARDRAVAPTGSLSIDSRRSRLVFHVRYFGVLRMQGEFRDVRGEIFGVDPRTLSASSITATVPIAGLRTGISVRDRHLSSRGYLGRRQSPEATFHSDRIIDNGPSGACVIGRLSLRGVAREVTLHVSECRYDAAARRVHARAHGTVHRSDFAVGPSRQAPWWDLRRYLIDDEVHLVIDVEAVERGNEA